MTGVVLVTSRSFGSGEYDPEAVLAEAGYRVVRAGSAHDLDELAPLLADADGWIAGTGPVTAAHLDLAPNLRGIARYGVGVDNVDLAAAAARGIPVTHTPGANSAAVAEHTLALLLTALRGIPAADRRVRAGDWSGAPARELSALIVGVVGLGRIGRLVTERLRAFGATVLGADPWVDARDPLFETVERADTETLSMRCDVVKLHAPGGQKVIDERWLTAADRPVLLVNTARADLVDEEAIARAARRGRVAAYAADTLAIETTGDAASPLLADDLADRVVVTAHLGAQTREGVDGMGRMATSASASTSSRGASSRAPRSTATTTPTGRSTSSASTRSSRRSSASGSRSTGWNSRRGTGGTANGPMVNGWTFSARAGIQHNNSVFVPASPAPQGERTAYLKSDSGLASRIDQTVVFPAGTYAITFAAANRVGFGGQQEFDVEVDGQKLGHYVPVGGEYQYYETAPFTVTQGEHTISFVATTTEGDNTGFVDDIRVVAAEIEPGDTVAPTVTVKQGAEFTQGDADASDKVSFKLYDAGKIDRAVINGVVKDLVDNTWSDVNFVAPGVFGAVSGENTLVVSDVAGNSTTVTFTLR